jgi:hypothetical protein
MSKITMPTAKFQDMVARANKGASENKLLPITSMMLIQLQDNVLSLMTTDTSNYLTIMSDKVPGENFYVVVPVDIFSKLVSKMTSESITMELKESGLEVKGNGSYHIPIPMDEDGPIRFPSYKFDAPELAQTIELTSVKNILEINKASLARSIETPCLCGYYLSDYVITTNEEVICFNGMRVMDGDYLISPDMMELLALSKEEKISCAYNDGMFLFKTPDMMLYGPEHDGKDLYPLSDIMGHREVEYPSMCRLPKLLLKSVIDRLSLFIEAYDKNGAYFTFTKDGVRITSKRSASVETVNYLESKNFTPFMCCVDIPMLKSQIDSTPADSIELHYGSEVAIKLVSDKVTRILALLEDENLGDENGKSE